MKRLIHVEDEGHDPQTFWAAVALLLAGAHRIAVALLRGELYAAAETRQPSSALDVMRSSRWPRVTVTRDTIIHVSETHYADGLEIAVRWRGAARTWRAGRRGAYIASRGAYLSHYGARSL